MCASIGVDPLASSKGFWSEMLGFGDFYYELGVQIIEVCMATSHKTGGLMELGELRERLVRSRGGSKRQNSQVRYMHILIILVELFLALKWYCNHTTNTYVGNIGRWCSKGNKEAQSFREWFFCDTSRKRKTSSSVNSRYDITYYLYLLMRFISTNLIV